MSKLLLIFFLGSIVKVSLCQNLIPNPSFENFLRMPCDLDEAAIPGMLVDWLQPIGTTTDYWNNLTYSDCTLNPNRVGIAPRSGSGMIGMIELSVINNLPTTYREYVEVQLTQPLIPGHLYCGEFYIKHNPIEFDEGDLFECNNMGMALTELMLADYSFNQPDHLALTAQVKDEQVIKLNEPWHKIKGCFVADKPYAFVQIGNFEASESTITINRLTNKTDHGEAYYFIDDVSLYELNYNIFSLAKEVDFCANKLQLELSAYVEGAIAYEWNTGETSPTINVSTKQSSQYTVSVHFNELVYRHTFNVTYVPDIDLGSDATLCTGEKILLKLDHPQNSYLWNDGTHESEKRIDTPGVYWVEVPSTCLVRDTITVSFLDCPGKIPNVITPNGDTFNEVFWIENVELVDWSLQVFNRWGEKVYESKKYKNDWSGAGLIEGIYYYELHSEKLNKTEKGWIHLLH